MTGPTMIVASHKSELKFETQPGIFVGFLIGAEAIGVGAARRCQKIGQQLQRDYGQQGRQFFRQVSVVPDSKELPALVIEELRRFCRGSLADEPDARPNFM